MSVKRTINCDFCDIEIDPITSAQGRVLALDREICVVDCCETCNTNVTHKTVQKAVIKATERALENKN